MKSVMRLATRWIVLWGYVSATSLVAEPSSTVPVRANGGCAYDRREMMTLDIHQFDETLGKGWRAIGDVPGCEPQAARLVEAYRRTHPGLADQDVRGLEWHEAQLRAGFGDTARAVVLFEKAKPRDHDVFSQERSLYADATIAFLRHDKSALLSIRARYVALPEPPEFKEAAERFHEKSGQTLVWPNNLGLIDSFIACFGKSYREAYSKQCKS